jgi:UDP-glucose 4-epimerase
VREVVETARRVSGRNFQVDVAARRAGDPVALVADVSRIRSTLAWRPQYDNLETIVSHALAWERRLSERRESARG